MFKFSRESNASWHGLIRSIYGHTSNGWDANVVVRWSHCCPCRAVAQGFLEFSEFICFSFADDLKILSKKIHGGVINFLTFTHLGM